MKAAARPPRFITAHMCCSLESEAQRNQTTDLITDPVTDPLTGGNMSFCVELIYSLWFSLVPRSGHLQVNHHLYVNECEWLSVRWTQ